MQALMVEMEKSILEVKENAINKLRLILINGKNMNILQIKAYNNRNGK